MIEFELEKPYSTKEVAEILGVSYGTFRNDRKAYEAKLTKAYDWELERRKYIFHKKKQDLYKLKSEELYNEVYLPKVIDVINVNPWNTGAGVTNEIWTEELMTQVQHMMSTAYTYVCKVLGNEYDITDRRYAACEGKGVYPRFMTDEEIKEWNQLKSQCAKANGEKIMELTEQWVNKIIKTSDYNKQVKNLASGAFLEALGTWFEEKGFIPVMLKHYEKKPELIMRDDDFEWGEEHDKN